MSVLAYRPKLLQPEPECTILHVILKKIQTRSNSQPPPHPIEGFASGVLIRKSKGVTLKARL